MKILFIFLLGFTSLVASAQSTEPWNLSYTTTEDLKQIFSLGPKDSVPDTLFTEKKDIIIYDVVGKNINFLTSSGSVVETDLEGKILYASKGEFVYYLKEEKQTATDGKKMLNAEEIEKYMLPIILEVEKI